MNPAANRAERNAKRFSDFVVSEADDIFEHHGHPVVGVQPIQQVLQIRRQFALGPLHIGAGRSLENAIGILGQGDGGTPLLFPHPIQEGVGSDSTQPALDIAGLVGGQSPLHAKQDVLNDVLRIMVISCQAVRQPINETAVDRCYFFPRRDCGDLRQQYQTPNRRRQPARP